MDQEPVLFTHYNGIAVSVDSSGSFTCVIDRVTLREPTYDKLKFKIEAELRTVAKSTVLALPCYAVVNTESATEPFMVVSLTLTGFNRNDSSWKWKDDNVKAVIVLPAVGGNLSLLKKYVAARNELNRIETILDDGRKLVARNLYYGGRIEASEYNNALSSLKTAYDCAVDRSI